MSLLSCTLLLNLARPPLGFAVLVNGTLQICHTTEQQRGSSEWLTSAITNIWRSCPPVDRVVVHLGGGSYTGIRSCLALARGLSLGGARLYGVSFPIDTVDDAKNNTAVSPAEFFKNLYLKVASAADSSLSPLQPLYGADKYAE